MPPDASVIAHRDRKATRHRMASSRPAQRRGQPPTSLSTTPKPVISVEDWEAKAPLTDLEARSVNLIKSANEKAPLPLKFAAEEAGPSRPSTPVQRGKLAPGSRPSTPSRAVHALHPKQPVQNPQQFYDWFALIDRSVAHSQEAHFRAHVASVAEHLDTCDFLVDRIDEVERELDGMMEGWRGVEEGGKSLKDACERLLEERDRLLELTDDISARLEYFKELEHATRMLNHPGESLIFQADFLYMVERVDICIDFLRDHRHFREAELYLMRFQQCMTRAMTLIKMNFVGSLRALSSDVSKRLSEKDISPTLQSHLLYSRFATISTRIAPLLGELERRAASYPEELSALLSECHSAYFTTRRQLIIPRVVEEIRGLDPGGSELVELTRAGCSYLKQLCTDEFDLYRKFFASGEEMLYQYLEILCDLLYDDLRPRILHEPRLTALCEVCTVLQALMVLDISSSETTSDDEEDEEGEESSESEESDELTVDLDNGQKKKGLGRLHIAHLLQMVLQDAQTRLFFKAQAVIQSDIQYYVPKDGDLKYPDLLIEARKPAAPMEIKEKESQSQLFRFLPSLHKQDTWYPTLRKMVWVLEQLHDFVKPVIFEDIAQEALSLTRQSLHAAANMIKTRSAFDGQLFLVRHLLILKEIMQGLELQGVKEMGPSKEGETKVQAGSMDALASMLGRTTSLLPDSVFASWGLRGDQSIRGAGQGIDEDLRNTCLDVIFLCVDPICEPLTSWVERIHAYTAAGASSLQEKTKSTPPPALASQAWASQAAASALLQQFNASLEKDLPSSVLKLRLYLEDGSTVRVLLGHVRDGIIDAYGEFRDVAANMYAGALRKEIKSPEEMKEILNKIYDEKDGS